MTGKLVDHRNLTAGYILHRAGNLVFCVKTGGIRIGVVIKLVGIQNAAVHQFGAFAAHHDQAAVGGVFSAHLAGKSRVESRIFLLPLDMTAVSRILIQQSCHIAVHTVGLGQVVDGHILIKLIQNVQGYIPQRV